MQIVIDIDPYVLEHCKRHVKEHYANNIEEAIANGILLSKEHRRLIDYAESRVNEVLDKIRAEMKQALREETVIDRAGGEYERIVSTIDPDDVFEILDKYKAETEDT